MKRLFLFCAILIACHASYAQDLPVRSAFSNLGVSLNGSTTGVGVTLSTPLAKHFVLRGGYQFSYLSYSYLFDDFDPINIAGTYVSVPSLELKAKLNSGAAHMMVDWVPFKKGMGTFFITAGFFLGRGDLLTVDGQFDMNDPTIKQIEDAGLLQDIEIDLGDDVVFLGRDGHMGAALDVNAFRPYAGLGWGRAIPKRRVGFRFELGAMFMGRPEVTSQNLRSGVIGSDISEFNEVLDKITVFPQISFQLTYRIFKDK